MGAPHGGLKHLRVYVVLRYILHLAVTERCVKGLSDYSYHGRRPRLRRRPCRVFRQTVWHYVKSGRPELFMYDRDSIKA